MTTRRDFMKYSGAAVGVAGAGFTVDAGLNYTDDLADRVDTTLTARKALKGELEVNVVEICPREEKVGGEYLAEDATESVEQLPGITKVDVEYYHVVPGEGITEEMYEELRNSNFEDRQSLIENHLPAVYAAGAHDRYEGQGSVTMFVGDYDNLGSLGTSIAGITAGPDESAPVAESAKSGYRTCYVNKDYNKDYPWFPTDTEKVLPVAVVHELGHQLGIGHPISTDVMSSSKVVQYLNCVTGNTDFGKGSIEQWSEVRDALEN